LRCAQVLRCLKSKYLSFFPARRVFRYAGMDVTQIRRYSSVISAHSTALPSELKDVATEASEDASLEISSEDASLEALSKDASPARGFCLMLDNRYLTCANGIQLPYFLSATRVTVYIHDFALRLELVIELASVAKFSRRRMGMVFPFPQ
jgi:hypothetical protein